MKLMTAESQLVVEGIGPIGLRRQDRATTGRAVHREVDSGLAEGGSDDLVLDLVLGPVCTGDPAVSGREDITDLPDRVRRIPRQSISYHAEHPRAPSPNRIVIGDDLEHAGVVCVDPERELSLSWRASEGLRVRQAQGLDVLIQPPPVHNESLIVHKRGVDDSLEQHVECPVVQGGL